MYATILRSAIVLHAVTVISFVCVVGAMSYTMSVADRWFLNGAWASPSVSEIHFAQEAWGNVTDIPMEELREHMDQILAVSWYGVHLTHIGAGLVVLGMGGLLSMRNCFIPMLGAYSHGLGGPVIVVMCIVVGVVRVQFHIYARFKQASARLLGTAENMILEVGTGASANN